MLLFVISRVIFYRLLLPSLQSYMTPNFWQLMSSLWKAICLWAVCFATFKAIKMLSIINPYRILFSQQGHCTLEKWSERNYGYFFLFNLFLEAYYFTILYWFCHTLTWVHHGCTCVPHPEPHFYLPPYLIPQGHPSAPALSTLYHASNLDWRSTYDNIHDSMPFSQTIPPSPSPTESKRVFYTSASLLMSCIQSYHYHFSKFHIYALVYCIDVFLSGLLHSL